MIIKIWKKIKALFGFKETPEIKCNPPQHLNGEDAASRNKMIRELYDTPKQKKKDLVCPVCDQLTDELLSCSVCGKKSCQDCLAYDPLEKKYYCEDCW